MGATTAWTREQVATRILAGEFIVIYGSIVLRIPQTWLDKHPGGDIAILHFVGRDAADEIEAYHSEDTLTLIERYAVASLHDSELPWQPLIPPLMTGWVRKLAPNGKRIWANDAAPLLSAEDTPHSPSSQVLLVEKDSELLDSSAPTLSTLLPPPTNLSLKVQAQHSAAYKALHKRIVNAGMYETPYLTGYGPEVASYLILGGLSAYTYSTNWLMTSAVFLGLMWHQLVFTAHDLGHMGVTHNWVFDRLLGIFIADFIGGLSIGWWVDNHNVHHLVTNHPSHDPDIEHLPFFAISTAFFSSLYSSYYRRIMPFTPSAAFFVSVQHKLFYVVMLLARFNLYINSYSYLIRKASDTKRARGGRWAWSLEVFGLVFFWTWFGSVLIGCGTWKKALAYLLVSHAVTSPLHIQIVLSHFSMSTADLGPIEAFPHRQLRTTTDVICPPHLAFLHGGLHLQVTHHLFPRLPRHNLRAASLLVKQFAKEQGLVYAEFGFMEGNGEVVGVLRSVAEQVKILGLVAEREIQEHLVKRA